MAADTMRVLFLVPQLPFPPEQGAALRNYNVLRHVAARHRMTLVGFGPPGAAPEALRRLCERVVCIAPPSRSRVRRLVDQARPAPDLALRLRSAQFGAAVANLWRVGPFDLVQ